jgi:multiple sugar transport system permease protein
MRTSSIRHLQVGAAYLISICFAIWLVFPPLWMILTSLKTGPEAFAIPPVWFFQPTLENYISVLQRPGMTSVFLNTVIVSVISTVIVLAIGAMAGYSMSRFKVGGDLLVSITMLFRVLPPIVLGLPMYVLFARVGLIDTLLALILAYVTLLLPITVWLTMAYFRDLPREVEEAALVDGCSRFGAFVRIAVPIARPGIVVTGFYTLMGAWNHFFYGLILSSMNARTLPLEASNFIGEFAVQWGEVSAIGTLIMLPPILVISFMQRQLVRGLALGAVKG